MRISTHGAAFFLSGMLCRVPRACVQTDRTARHAAVLASSIPPNVGSPSAGDEAEFIADPAAFCMKRSRQIGPVFATGALGGAFFVGSSSAIDALASARTAAEPAELQGPFEGLEAGYDFSACCAVFNDELHAGLFEWIPLYKESGGFSSFRFEDFIDKRVRRLAPSLRRLLLRALLPVVVGVRWAEMPPEPAPEALLDAYEMYSAKLRGERAFGKELQSLIFGRNPDAAAQLGPALDKLAAGTGTRALGGPALPCLASAIEQITSLLSSMLLQDQRHPEWAARLAEEQEAALSGTEPEAPITADLLAKMPLLDAFTRETLRLYPPSRPARRRLAEELRVDGIGSLVAAEPFVAHFVPSSYADPTKFNPSRWVGAGGAQLPAVIGFAGAIGETAGAQLAVDMCKAAFVQMHRMFKVRVDKEAASPKGFPLHIIPDSVEVLLAPRMYYELKRGTRKPVL